MRFQESGVGQLVPDPVGTVDEDPIPSRLTSRVPYAIVLGMPFEEALPRLRAAVASSASVDFRSEAMDRRLSGEVAEAAIRLSVEDSALARRRRGWKVQFRGRIERAPGRGALRGVIEIENTNLVRRFIWVFRIAALVPLAFGIASLLSRNGVDIGTFIFGAAISLIAFVAINQLDASIERLAADDARAMTNYLRSHLG
jgi:hypothetical protein